MAFIHHAYTFDSIAFHKELQATVVDDGKLDLQKLQNWAKSIAANANEELKRILNTINYYDDWLNDPDGDASQAYLWYTICLTNVFHPTLSLSNNRYGGSHFVLERILKAAGWQEKDVIKIILGDYRLEKLLDNPEYRIFIDELSLYGGTLNRKKIPSILSHLRESAQFFAPDSSEVRRIIGEYTSYNVPDVNTIPIRAFQDAVDMLETAINRNEDLYLYRN